MSTGQLEQFSCEGCGKSYRWKPELAGKRVKCKCGHTMTVPQPPAAPPAESAFDDDPFGDALSAMAEAEHAGTTAIAEPDLPRCPSCASVMSSGATTCVQCGYNVNTGKIAGAKGKKGAQPMGVGGADGGAMAIAPAAPTAGNRAPGGVLAYAGMPVRRGLSSRAEANAGDNNIGEPFKDLYLPIGLFLLGVALTFCEARFGRGIGDMTIAMAFTAFTVVINLVLVFVAIMMAVRLLSLGLGPVGPALIKIAAISVLPGAISGMLFHVLGGAGYFIIWVLNLILIYGMFMGLLGLDFQETGICSCIIWVVRTWVGYAIVFALLNGLGMAISSGSRSSSAALAALSGPSTGKLKSPKPAKPKVTPAQIDAKSTEVLGQAGAVEARAWVAAGTDDHPRQIPRFADIPSSKVIDELYQMGAKQVMITKTNSPSNRDINVRQLVITLPDDKEQRADLVSWGKSITKEFGGASQPDIGQKYLLIDFEADANVPWMVPELGNGEGDAEGDPSAQ